MTKASATPVRTRSRLAGMALALAAFAVSAAGFAPAATAQAAWPDRTITLVVPFAPAGTTDILGRILAEGLSAELGRTVIVDNKPGAGGGLGTESVARASPDGYTLLLGTVGTHAINPHLYPDLSYDSVSDFAPISLVATVPNVLVANPAQPFDSVKDLVAYAKEHPGEIFFGSSGIGSSIHLSTELFKLKAGVEMEHVPYTGSGPAVTALLSNEIGIMFDNLPSSIQHVRSGALKALAVTTAQRSEALPDVPTVAESGLAGYEATSWFGLFAPAGTPPAVVERLNAATVKVLRDPRIVERMAQQGATPRPDAPAEFAHFIEGESAKWGDVIKAANVTMQ